MGAGIPMAEGELRAPSAGNRGDHPGVHFPVDWTGE